MVSYLTSYLSLRQDHRGVTAMEYALIAALIGLVIAIALTTLGVNMNSVFTKLGTSLSS